MNNSDNVTMWTVLSAAPLIIIVIIWLLAAVVAASIAPAGRGGTFFLITFFFLGPLGIAAAAIAQPRTPLYVTLAARPLAPGRERHFCPRCGAETDLPNGTTTYDCWRCSINVEVKRREPSPPPKKAAEKFWHRGWYFD